MCGIVGYVGQRPAVDVLVGGLRRLEYRGYDSAGVAYFRAGKIEIRKSEGKLENVQKIIENEPEGAGGAAAIRDARCGIGHTRWATHGKPTTQNAHPHQVGHVVLVHNGIIENYQEIKREIIAKGGKPRSETDSELFGFLVLERMDAGAGLVEAVRQSFSRLHGQCSVVVMSEREPGVVVGVRNGSPLVAARDPQGGAILASDAQPLLEYTQDVIFLEHGDVAVGTVDGLKFLSLETGKPVERATSRLDWSPDRLDKQGYPHYMLKEICEQPVALVDTLNGLLDRASNEPFPLAAQPGVELLRQAKEITIVACGTAYLSGMVGKYYLERLARMPAYVELASEFRYRDPVLGQGALVIGISQSGETADTLAAIREAKRLGVPTLAVTNTRGSTLSREADAVFFTSAGPEIGVAATKSFITQVETMLLIAGFLARQRGNGASDRAGKLFGELVKLPHLLADALDLKGPMVTDVKRAARGLYDAKGFFFIGRGTSYPLALEGALKLKEIAYVHAEGYAAGELKHGPIAMIDRDMAVVVLAPRDIWREKTVSNLEEVKARGAKVLAIGDARDEELKNLADFWVPLPAGFQDIDESLLAFALTPVVQLFSYELAVLKGTDVDKPRNLAKSVTVE